MSMNQNDDIRYLDIGLPEDIARLKAIGDFENAIRLIDMRLSDPKTTAPLAACMRVQREIMLRLPRNYPYTFEAAMARIHEDIPDFTEDEFHALEDINRIGWIFVNGERHYFKRFHQTLLKTDPAYAKRANIQDTGTSQGEDKPTETVSPLERAMNIMRERGSFGARIRIRASIRIDDDAFIPGKVVKVHLPIPAKCIQQSNIKLIAFSHEPKHICAEDAPIRTVYFEEKLNENAEFFVEYEYDNIAPYCDTCKLIPAAEQPNDFDTQEQSPHVVFTPYIRELVKELGAGCANNLEKARNFYDFVTTKVMYSFMPEYFCLESIAEGCARNLKGDCGVQALLFITLCRCAGIPAKWQSGLYAASKDVGHHDWAQFYIAPYGWLFADASFGGSAYRAKNYPRWNHYFGNLDPYRMIANSEFQHPLDPAETFWRHDPYDNQGGEIEYADAAIPASKVTTHEQMIDINEI